MNYEHPFLRNSADIDGLTNKELSYAQVINKAGNFVNSDKQFLLHICPPHLL